MRKITPQKKTDAMKHIMKQLTKTVITGMTASLYNYNIVLLMYLDYFKHLTID